MVVDRIQLGFYYVYVGEEQLNITVCQCVMGIFSFIMHKELGISGVRILVLTSSDFFSKFGNDIIGGDTPLFNSGGGGGPGLYAPPPPILITPLVFKPNFEVTRLF